MSIGSSSTVSSHSSTNLGGERVGLGNGDMVALRESLRNFACSRVGRTDGWKNDCVLLRESSALGSGATAELVGLASCFLGRSAGSSLPKSTFNLFNQRT